MPDITDLPVMTRADAVSLGFAGYNDVPHRCVDVPDGAFTITAKTSEGRRATFCFMGKRYDGPARFCDIQFHDRGTTILNANNGVSPTFNAFAITRGGRHVIDSRPLAEDEKPSILVLLMDEAGDEPPRPARERLPMKDRDLADLLDRAAMVLADPHEHVLADHGDLIDTLTAEAARRRR